MNSSLVKSLAVATTTLAASHALAQDSDSRTSDASLLETIVVTATRYQQDIDKIPGAITVISRQDLDTQLSFSDDLPSVLATLIPSMTPSRQKLSNQGENLRCRTALIMVDGVPQNNPLRNCNRYGYSVDSSVVERIDVISGASAVHGMGATGGLINEQA
jgi:iron complex outermembrane receptor protein